MNSKYGSAVAYEKLGQFEKAISIYNEVVLENPNTPNAKNSLFRIGEIQMESFSNYKEAEKFFKKVLNKRPFSDKNTEALFRIADCYLARNLLEETYEQYDQIILQKSSSHNYKMKALLMQGKIFFWKGDFESASKKFENVQTDHINITNELAGFYVNDALEYSMLIDENKNSDGALKLFALADLLTAQKKFEQARNKYKEVIKIDSTQNLIDDSWLKIGQICFRLQKYEEAIAAYQIIVDEHNESVYVDLAQKEIGDVYSDGLKNYSNALKAYELVLMNYPDSIYLEEVRKKIREIEKNVL